MTAVTMEQQALLRARVARATGSRTAGFLLWKLARKRDGTMDLERFHHLMVEAGYVPDRATGLPYERCPLCGHVFPAVEPIAA